MKSKKILNFFIWIPFAVAIGAFVLYFRYLFEINMLANTPVTAQVNLIMDRYLKIGLFSLFIALVILFINRLSKLIFNEEKYYKENHPWTNEVKEEKQDNISDDDLEDALITEEVKEEKIILNENPSSNDKLSEDIKNNKVLKARFIDKNNEEKMIEILTDEEEEIEVLSLDNVVLMPEVKRQTVIKVDSSKVTIDGFKKCPKCGNFIVNEAVICVHCGILLDQSLNGKITKDYKKVGKNKKRKFNPVKFAINGIIILLGLIAIIIMCNKIEDQKAINESKMNTQITNIESTN